MTSNIGFLMPNLQRRISLLSTGKMIIFKTTHKNTDSNKQNQHGKSGDNPNQTSNSGSLPSKKKQCHYCGKEGHSYKENQKVACPDKLAGKEVCEDFKRWLEKKQKQSNASMTDLSDKRQKCP